MRDNHEGYPEILDVVEEGGFAHALVQLEVEGQVRRFRFSVSAEGYRALRRLLQLRPFDKMPGSAYRYFFVSGQRTSARGKPRMIVRVEQGRNAKQLEVDAPLDLLANMEWWRELRDFKLAEAFAI
jgi:hypothetical protein